MTPLEWEATYLQHLNTMAREFLKKRSYEWIWKTYKAHRSSLLTENIHATVSQLQLSTVSDEHPQRTALSWQSRDAETYSLNFRLVTGFVCLPVSVSLFGSVMRRRLVRNDATQKAAVRPRALHHLLFLPIASFVQTPICQSFYRSMRAWLLRLLRAQSLLLQSAVTGIFHLILPAALWPWGQLILWQKCVPQILPGRGGYQDGRRTRLTNLRPSCHYCLEILGASISLEFQGLYRNSFTFTFTFTFMNN